MEEMKPYEQDFYAPMPTTATRRMRTNLVWQFWRFLVINFKMIRITRFH